MRKRILFYIFFVSGLTSCLIADDFFKPEAPYKDPLDIVVKDSVRSYILQSINKDESYLNYGFGELKVLVPSEIANYEKWSKREGDVNFDQKKVAQKKYELDSIIKFKKLERTLTIEHVFSVRGLNDSLGEVNRINFLLNEDFEVKDFQPKYALNLSEKEEEVFANFYYETPLLKGYSPQEAKTLNDSFYSFFKNRLDSLPSMRGRENFLNHVIDICAVVMVHKTFDQQAISERLVKQYFSQGEHEVSGYTPLRFSDLYQINQEGELQGYYLFHTFNFKIDEAVDSMNVYVKFSPYYEIESVFETDQDFESKTSDNK